MPLVSIQDIAPPELATELVLLPRVNAEIEVRGITSKDLLALGKRYPMLIKQVTGAAIAVEERFVTNLEVVPALVAAGLGKVGDKDVEKLVQQNLTDEERMMLLQAIMRLTNPEPESEAAGPFVAAAAAAANGAQNPGKETASISSE